MFRCLVIISITIAACNGLYIDAPENKGNQWALLVAGSKGWENYRHQENRILANIEDVSLDVLKVYRLSDSHEQHTKLLNRPEPIVSVCEASTTSQDSININNGREKDEFDTFGEHVATSIRNLKEKHKQAIAKFQINNLLYKTEMEQYKQPIKQSNWEYSSTSSTMNTPPNNDVEDKYIDSITENALLT